MFCHRASAAQSGSLTIASLVLIVILMCTQIKHNTILFRKNLPNVLDELFEVKCSPKARTADKQQEQRTKDKGTKWLMRISNVLPLQPWCWFWLSRSAGWLLKQKDTKLLNMILAFFTRQRFRHVTHLEEIHIQFETTSRMRTEERCVGYSLGLHSPGDRYKPSKQFPVRCVCVHSVAVVWFW